MNDSKVSAYFAGAGMCLIFGSAYIAMKIALETINPFLTILLRYLFGAIVLHVIYYSRKKREKIRRSDLKALIFLCLLEPGLFFIFDAYGLKFTTAVRASIILSTIPVMTAVFAVPILKEKLTTLKVVTTSGSIIGVVMVVSAAEPITSGSSYLLGDLFIFLACISAALYTGLARKMSFRYSFFTITRFQSLIAVIFFLPLSLGEGLVCGFGMPSMKSFVATVFLGVVSSAFGYLLLNFTISRLSAANSSIFANLVPVVTMILSSLILKEYIGTLKVIGLLIVMSFVFLLSWGERKK